MASKQNAVDSGHVREDPILLPKFPIKGIGEELPASIRERILAADPLSFAEQDQLLRLEHGERTEQNGVQKAENRCVRANAESQGENGDRGRAGIPGEHPQSETDILEEIATKPVAGLIKLFLGLSDIAEGAASSHHR